jgi:hypothetical protein
MPREILGQSTITPTASPLWVRLVWFVALWVGGVATVGAAAYAIKLVIM